MSDTHDTSIDILRGVCGDFATVVDELCESIEKIFLSDEREEHKEENAKYIAAIKQIAETGRNAADLLCVALHDGDKEKEFEAFQGLSIYKRAFDVIAQALIPDEKDALSEAVEICVHSPAHKGDSTYITGGTQKYRGEIRAIMDAPQKVKPIIPYIAVELEQAGIEDKGDVLITIAHNFTDGGHLKERTAPISDDIRAIVAKARRKYNAACGAKQPKEKRSCQNAIADDVASVVVKASYIKQGIATNELSRTIPTKHNTVTNPISHETTITRGDFSISIPYYEQLPNISTSTFMLLDAFLMRVARGEIKDRTVYLDLDDYMKWRGLSNRDEARNRMTADAKILLSISMTWSEKIGGKWRERKGRALGDSWDWIDGNRTRMYFKFGETFYNESLKHYRVMYYPPELPERDNKRNPNSYHLGRKISELKSMNRGKDNEDLISVKTLLAAAPYIPAYEDVMSGNRNVTERIIEPFERDMDALNDIFKWEYCHSKGEPLTDEEIAHMDYFTFIELIVHITWNNYPETEKKATE